MYILSGYKQKKTYRTKQNKNKKIGIKKDVASSNNNMSNHRSALLGKRKDMFVSI